MNQQIISDELGRAICRVRDTAIGEGCAVTKGVNLSSIEARAGLATHSYIRAARIVLQQVIDTAIFHVLVAADAGEINVKFGSQVSGFVGLNANSGYLPISIPVLPLVHRHSQEHFAFDSNMSIGIIVCDFAMRNTEIVFECSFQFSVRIVFLIFSVGY